MISNDIIQAAILAKTQTTTTLTVALTDGANGIKQLNYKGTDFHYPCVRLALEGQTDLSETSCPSRVEFSFYIFSEKASSKEADQIAGIIVSAFRGLSFSQNSIKFVKINILENIPAIAQDERLWRAQIRCRTIIHNG
jgi:hypothetical protein